MKKQLLLGTALFAAISAFPQLNKTVGTGNVLDMRKERAYRNAGVNEDRPISPMVGSGLQIKNSSERPASPPTAVTWKLLTGSMNTYGMLVSTTRPLQYNPNVNAVSFVHRKSDFYTPSPNVPNTAASGVIVAEISTDWGNSWDSTCIWSDANQWGRYPQGAIYSAPGNTNIASSYIVGCGPTVSGSLFTGDWYASKQLNSFNATPSTATGAQQFLSFTLGSYPANQTQHGWSRNGFSSTNDGIVRSLAVLENDLQGLTTMRGFAVVTGTFNGTAFDWSTDTLVPNCILDPSLEKHLNPDPQMAWNQAGTVGYVVGIGALTTGTEATMGYQPIIYKMDKTLSPNATWTLMPSIDFNSMAMRPIVLSKFNGKWGLSDLYIATNGDTIGAPYVNDFDLAVDANNNLHIGATLCSTARTNPDSLNYISQFTTSINPTELYKWRHVNGSRPYIYDFIGNGVQPWTYRLVDSIATEGPSSAVGYPGYAENPWDPTGTGSAKVGMDSRLQLGRTPNGQYITYSWAESDTAYTNSQYKWNNLPDIKLRVMAVTSGTNSYVVDAGPEQNMTASSNDVRTRATLHYMSPVTGAATIYTSVTSFYTVDINVPLTVTNSNPYSQLTNNATWYGASLGSFKFKQSSTVGINDNSMLASTSNIYPNPAQGSAILALALEQSSAVEINIVNTVGQSVKVIRTHVRLAKIICVLIFQVFLQVFTWLI